MNPEAVAFRIAQAVTTTFTQIERITPPPSLATVRLILAAEIYRVALAELLASERTIPTGREHRGFTG